MGRILGRHPSVFTFEELHFFEQWWQPRLPPSVTQPAEAVRLAAVLLGTQREGYRHHHRGRGCEADAKALVQTIEPPLTAPRVFAAFMAREAAAHGAEAGCDQTPRNLYYLPELLELYQEAVAVVMVRDPRDVLLSQKNRWHRRSLGARRATRRNVVRTWSGYHPFTISVLWRSGVRAGARVTGHPRVVHVRFEDLLSDPVAQVKTVCDRVGIEFEPQMLDVPHIGSSNVADRPNEHGIDPATAGRWREGLSPTEAWICQRVTLAEMASHGYRPAMVRPSPARVVGSGLSLAGKSGLALAMNARRSKNLFEAARRRLAS